MVVIRESNKSDEESIDRLTVEANASLRKFYRPTKQTLANKDELLLNTTRLVAIVDNRIVGTVLYKFKDECIHLIGISVLPEFQKTGIATELINEAERIGHKNKLSHISLYTIKQTDNVQIFSKLGFITVLEQDDKLCESDVFEKLIVVHMKKAINSESTRPTKGSS